ncbi:hypothetical protein LVO79_18235 (plasmid) [Roseivivax marinus]|uniref:hypothetical protein n=1 Tax=Roseivivax marinus TaxID=1379903 RepID=UPI001F048FFE|nr:hypothetical protein [Roseivivax marinus]UMA66972.1 hypothetical protein LVO79_18235 [Roseivivax marinus]
MRHPAQTTLTSAEYRGAATKITGGHILADRNRRKFYIPRGEIAKVDEAAILA